MRNLIVLALIGIFSITTYAQKIVFFNSKKLPEEVNSELDESIPILSADGKTLYFVRSGLSGGKGAEDIWYSTKDNEGNWSYAKNDLKNLNNKEPNMIIGVSHKNDKIYLRNAFDKIQKHIMSVAVSVKEDDKWQEPTNLSALPDFGFKGKYYTLYLSHNEKYLFVSMNMEGSNGKEDLYILTKNDNNIWSKPFHLDENINSTGAEYSPFITEDGKYLFFSSDGHGGLGDMDIFVSERLDDSYHKWSDPKNLGRNINSTGFDAYFHVANDNTAYYSTTRGDEQYEDIYTSEMHIYVKKKRQVIIHDLNNIEVVTKGANNIEERFRFVNIESMKDYLITHGKDTLITGDLSEFDYDIIFQLDSNSKLKEKLIKLKNIKGYETLEELLIGEKILTGESIDFDNLSAAIIGLENLEKATMDSTKTDSIPIEPVVVEKEENPFPANMLVKTVYHGYDSDKSENLKDIITILKSNPYLKISIESHTDSKGSEEYNMNLSNRRASGAKTYLLRQGISGARISVKSFGELKPLQPNTLSNGSDNPEGRAKNRRTEFRVVSNKKF